MSGGEFRLVACDMDGTLLDSQKRQPPGLPALLAALRERGIAFVVASGRQYAILRRDFAGMDEGMYYLCENGSMIMRDDQLVMVDALPAAAAAEVIRLARTIPGAHPLVCAVEGAWYEGPEEGQEGYFAAVRRYNLLHHHCEDLLEVLPQLRICKISVFDDLGAEHNAYPQLLPLDGEQQTVCLSGQIWVDIMRAGVNKGSAVQFLQGRLGLAPEECLAFGDYLNDVEMMDACGQSYAMKNAHPLLKERCRYVTEGTNDEDGVCATLRQRLGLA